MGLYSEPQVRKFLETAVPLWSHAGRNLPYGGLFEHLSQTSLGIDGTRRTLTQARQIYAFRVAGELGILPFAASQRIVKDGLDYLLQRCRGASGAFHFSTTHEGNVESTALELYTQAFALFGLAQAGRQDLSRLSDVRAPALKLLQYLRSERRTPTGEGYTETKSGPSPYASNPHMHLFEAALAWAESDPSEQAWRLLADELAELALMRFVDPTTGLLAEFFDEHWSPLRDSAGRFYFEPGHQYEWSWLLGWYSRLFERAKGPGRAAEIDLLSVRIRLFKQAEVLGRHPQRRYPIDEVWSDGSPKSLSSRFWPHCERLKAAVRLKHELHEASEVTEEALRDLFGYLDVPSSGLWLDQRNSDGQLIPGPAKASSFYHIIGALFEYLTQTRTEL